MSKNLKTLESKKEILFFIIIICVAIGVWLCNIKIYGDIFRFLPLFLGLFLLYRRAFRPAFSLAICAFIMLLCVFLLKNFFGYLALHGIEMPLINISAEFFQNLARRPINGKFSGFPSGHSANSFFAFGFALRLYFIDKRYYKIMDYKTLDSNNIIISSAFLPKNLENRIYKKPTKNMAKKWLFLIFFLAFFVALSRVFTLYHTPTQVIFGSIIGFILGFFIHILGRKSDL